MLPRVPRTLKTSPGIHKVIFTPSARDQRPTRGKKEITHPLIPYPHITVMAGGKAVSIFLFHLTWEAPAAKKNQGRKLLPSVPSEAERSTARGAG